MIDDGNHCHRVKHSSYSSAHFRVNRHFELSIMIEYSSDPWYRVQRHKGAEAVTVPLNALLRKVMLRDLEAKRV